MSNYLLFIVRVCVILPHDNLLKPKIYIQLYIIPIPTSNKSEKIYICIMYINDEMQQEENEHKNYNIKGKWIKNGVKKNYIYL